MDEWLQEFRNWTTEEEEFQDFAQYLCGEFINWKTAEEEFEEFAGSFLAQRFQGLPLDIVRRIRCMVWEYQKKKKYLPFGLVNGPAVTCHSLQAWNHYIRQYRTECRQHVHRCCGGHVHKPKGI